MAKLIKDGLLLRSLAEGVQADVNNLPEFFHYAFEDEGTVEDNGLSHWINDLLHKHPAMSLDDFWIIADPANDGKIVSGLLLIPQVWRYEDIEIPVGRVEIVATLPAYRRRGLQRILMDAIHERSSQRGHLIQGITGIPNFYRKFGYTMAINLGLEYDLPLRFIPDLKDDETLKYTLREATEADIPTLIALDHYAVKSALVSAVRDTELYRFELNRSQKSWIYHRFVMIADETGDAIGYMALTNSGENDSDIGCVRLIIGEKSNYVEMFAPLLQSIKVYAKNISEKMQSVFFSSNNHPILKQLVSRTYGAYHGTHAYAWYMRIGNWIGFFKKIAPVLEKRLENSGAHGYTGTLAIRFYDLNCLQLIFEKGCLKDVIYGAQPDDIKIDASFPYESFLDVVFGHRDLTEIGYILPEAFGSREGRVLIDILFPKKPTMLFPIF